MQVVRGGGEELDLVPGGDEDECQVHDDVGHKLEQRNLQESVYFVDGGQKTQ